MPETSISASETRAQGNRIVAIGIAAIVGILALAAIILFSNLPGADAFNARVERMFVENADLTGQAEIRLLEILAQSGTAFSETLDSYRFVIFVLLVFATALLVAAVAFLVMLIALNRRQIGPERAVGQGVRQPGQGRRNDNDPAVLIGRKSFKPDDREPPVIPGVGPGVLKAKGVQGPLEKAVGCVYANVAVVQKVHQRHRSVREAGILQTTALCLQGLVDVVENSLCTFFPVQHLTESCKHTAGLFERSGALLVNADNIGGRNAL